MRATTLVQKKPVSFGNWGKLPEGNPFHKLSRRLRAGKPCWGGHGRHFSKSDWSFVGIPGILNLGRDLTELVGGKTPAICG